MARWEHDYHAGDNWDYEGDIAAVGFIKEDCTYHVCANTYGPTEIDLDAGTEVWATFSWDRSDESAPGYDIWYEGGYSGAEWLDGGDAYDLTEYIEEIEWDEEIFDEITERYRNGDFD